MKGAGPDIARLFAEHTLETVFELSRGLVGKGNGQDPPRGDGVKRCKLFCLLTALQKLFQHLLIRPVRQTVAVGSAAVF